MDDFVKICTRLQEINGFCR